MFFGPFFRSRNLIISNLSKAFPKLSLDEKKVILKNMWFNYGKILAEYTFIKNFRESKEFEDKIIIENRNILEKINNEVNLVLPYEEYHHCAYQRKPNDIYDKNRIYFFTHGQNDFEINEYVADVIISESAKNRKSEKLLRAEKINYKVIHELNIDIVNRNINDLEKWRKIQSNSYEIQYQIDEINSLRNKLDEKLKSFEEKEYNFVNNYSILECIKEHPKHNNNMCNWLKKQDRFLIGYHEFMKDKK